MRPTDWNPVLKYSHQIPTTPKDINVKLNQLLDQVENINQADLKHKIYSNISNSLGRLEMANYFLN